jgi:uncharacterized phage protein (TIGR01671 family)
VGVKGGKRMNDRFKFRAWWKPNYRKPIMLYDVEKTYDFMRGEPESICAECFGEVLEDEDYIVMQCTGLKDKNGTLIYELDYVRYAKNKYKVEIDKFLGISLTNILNGDTIVMDDIVLFNCEVIGNEFESNTKI